MKRYTIKNDAGVTPDKKGEYVLYEDVKLLIQTVFHYTSNLKDNITNVPKNLRDALVPFLPLPDTTFQQVTSDCYISVKGARIKREYGNAPNGTSFSGRWVYRDSNGEIIDFDTCRNDLVERHSVVLTS